MGGAVMRRREFLASASLSAFVLTACATGASDGASDCGGCIGLLYTPSDEDERALRRMARLLYPHDAIGDDVYADVVDGFTLTSRREAITELEDGVALLDGQGRGSWLSRSEAEQIAALTAIEGTPFFTMVRGSVQAGLYEHPAMWAHLGYPGPSLPFGGYWDKGFDDIDWLPSEGEDA